MSSRISQRMRGAEPGQAGERTLYAPTLGSTSRTMLGAASRDNGPHPEPPDGAAVLVVVVAPVAEHDVGAAPGLTTIAPYQLDGFEERNELGDIVAVAAGQGNGERDAGCIGDQVESRTVWHASTCLRRWRVNDDMDKVFKTLSDATRRLFLDRLREDNGPTFAVRHRTRG